MTLCLKTSQANRKDLKIYLRQHLIIFRTTICASGRGGILRQCCASARRRRRHHRQGRSERESVSTSCGDGGVDALDAGARPTSSRFSTRGSSSCTTPTTTCTWSCWARCRIACLSSRASPVPSLPSSIFSTSASFFRIRQATSVSRCRCRSMCPSHCRTLESSCTSSLSLSSSLHLRSGRRPASALPSSVGRNPARLV